MKNEVKRQNLFKTKKELDAFVKEIKQTRNVTFLDRPVGKNDYGMYHLVWYEIKD